MSLLAIGLNHRTAPVELREQLYVTGDAIYPLLTQLDNACAAVQEVAIISTCNRLEVYANASDLTIAAQDITDHLCRHYNLAPGDLSPHLYIHHGHAATRHLMHVASGLDSMILGEAQILGQVGSALEYAAAVNTTGTVLHRMFESAMRAGKRARNETAIAEHTTSISHAAAQLVRNQTMGEEPTVLVVGAGDMARLAARAVRDLGIQDVSIINRTFANAQRLAAELQMVAHEWSFLWDRLEEADAVIVATGAPHLVLYANDLQLVMQRRTNPLLLVDIAVPRNIDPEAAHLENVGMYDIDDMQAVVDHNLAQRSAAIPDVQRIIDHETKSFAAWLNERTVVPVIKELRQEVSGVIQTELAATLSRLEHLADTDRKAIEKMAHRITNKLLHGPTALLREAANSDESETVAHIVREMFGLNTSEPETTPEKTVHAH